MHGHVTHALCVTNLQGEIRWQLETARPSRGRILDLLFIAVNQGTKYAVWPLLEYDLSHTKVLYAITTESAGDSISRARDSDVHLQDTHVQQLEQLLLTCLTANHVGLLKVFVKEASALAFLGE